MNTHTHTHTHTCACACTSRPGQRNTDQRDTDQRQVHRPIRTHIHASIGSSAAGDGSTGTLTPCTPVTMMTRSSAGVEMRGVGTDLRTHLRTDLRSHLRSHIRLSHDQKGLQSTAQMQPCSVSATGPVYRPVFSKDASHQIGHHTSQAIPSPGPTRQERSSHDRESRGRRAHTPMSPARRRQIRQEKNMR